MIDPYKMVIVNLVLSISLIVVAFIYVKIIPKKKINLFVLLVLISILPIVSVFRKGTYESGDFTFHIYRAMDFYQSLSDGVFIPSWAGGLNEGFGYPVFIFIYNFPYYLISFLHFLGFSFIFSQKLILAGSFIGSGIVMWIVLKKITKNDLASFAGSILYLFSPYHLVDLHFRVSIAEVLAFVINPLIFYLVLKTIEKQKLIYFAWISLFLSVLFLTHPPMFIFYTLIFIIYILYQIFTKKISLKILVGIFISILIGLIISSYAIIPRFSLIKYTTDSLLIKTPIDHVDFQELLFSPWRLGFLFQGPQGELSFAIGYTGIFIFLISLFLLFKKPHKKYYSDVLFWFIISFWTIFFMLSYSKPIWDLFPHLRIMQFAYRLLHPLIFSLSILLAYLVLIYKPKKTLIYFFLILTIGYTMLNWGNRRTIPQIDDAWIRDNLPHSTKQGEQNYESVPLWWNNTKDLLVPAKSNLELVEGDARIKELSRNSIRHTYGIDVNKPSKFVENTLYFPNWTISANRKQVQINYMDEKYNPRIGFELAPGLYFVDVMYHDVIEVKYAKRISIVTTLVLLFYIILFHVSQISKFIFTRLPITIRKYG